jgi:hypothetical protein
MIPPTPAVSGSPLGFQQLTPSAATAPHRPRRRHAGGHRLGGFVHLA